MAQVTIYLADDVVEEVDRLRVAECEPGKAPQSRTKAFEAIVWDGLPSPSKLTIQRARRAKREGKA